MEFRSLHEMFMDRVKKYSDREAYRYKKGGKWISVSWKEYAKQVRGLALSLMSLGLGKGDRVCIISNTRYEWDLADKAVLMFGGITVGIYQTLPADQTQYILAHSDAKAVVVENRTQFEKVGQVRNLCPALETVIVLDPEGCGTIGFSVFDDLVRPSQEKEQRYEGELDETANSVGPDDPATYIYTSGTTGPPKGVVLSHENLLWEAKFFAEGFEVNDKDLTLTWLPFAHVMQRAMSAVGLWGGAPTAYAEGIDRLLDNLGEVRPTIFYSVPRIFEKAHANILEKADGSGPVKRKLFYWSIEVGQEASRARQDSRPLPLGLALKYRIARKLVFEKIKAFFGGRVRFIGSGAAPISRDILEFFHAADILALEAYGATETSCGITYNIPSQYRFGTVGKACPDIEIKIAGDGEILVRGPLIFKGYFKDEEKTQEALTGDGFYRTGDVGEFDQDGFLKITDRKKDIIVTSGGKNIAPQNIENMLKKSPFISQAMVHGDKRSFLTALLTLNPDGLIPWAKKEQIAADDWNALCKESRVRNLIEGEVAKVNQGLARHETVKSFSILGEDFTVENGQLTPTLKVKRKVVTEKYKELLDSMYGV